MWIARAVAIIAVILLLLAIVGLAHAHGDAAWIMQVDPGCCGPKDCAAEPDGAIERVNGGYLVKATGEIIPTDRAKVSIDEHYWRCHYSSGEMAGKTRCLFVPALGV